MCFIDLTQAFDKVILTDIIKLLEERKVHQNIVSIIREINNGNHTLVKTKNGTTRKMTVNTAIRQGDILNPSKTSSWIKSLQKQNKMEGDIEWETQK